MVVEALSYGDAARPDFISENSLPPKFPVREGQKHTSYKIWRVKVEQGHFIFYAQKVESGTFL